MKSTSEHVAWRLLTKNGMNTNQARTLCRELIIARPRFATEALCPGYTLRDVVAEVAQIGATTLARWIQALQAMRVETIQQDGATWELKHFDKLKH